MFAKRVVNLASFKQVLMKTSLDFAIPDPCEFTVEVRCAEELVLVAVNKDGEEIYLEKGSFIRQGYRLLGGDGIRLLRTKKGNQVQSVAVSVRFEARDGETVLDPTPLAVPVPGAMKVSEKAMMRELIQAELRARGLIQDDADLLDLEQDDLEFEDYDEDFGQGFEEPEEDLSEVVPDRPNAGDGLAEGSAPADDGEDRQGDRGEPAAAGAGTPPQPDKGRPAEG